MALFKDFVTASNFETSRVGGTIPRPSAIWPWLSGQAVNYRAMEPRSRSRDHCCLVCLAITRVGFGSAYNARPKLVVIVVIDQFRGDYLERYRDQWGEGGFRLLLDHGANFTDCNYNYANTRTAPGHATLLTGAYSNGHGIMANEWWDPEKKTSGDVGRRRSDQTGWHQPAPGPALRRTICWRTRWAMN